MTRFYKALHRLDHTKIEGWVYFETENVLQQFELALNQIDAAIAVGHGHETELGVRTVNIGEARDRLDAVAHAARGLRLFFTQPYLNWVVWSVNDLIGQSRYDVDVDGRGVVDKYTQASVGLPDDYPVLNTEPLRKLRDLKS